MRAVQNAIAANWQWFTALYAVSLLLAWGFGWVGYCAALALAFALRHRIYAFSRRNCSVLHLIEAWYFNDDVRDLIKPVDAKGEGEDA